MDSKQLAVQRKLLVEFIETYKELACLWDRKHPGYGVRGARQAAYQRLLRQYRAIDPHATLHSIKSRVDVIRNGFIRELKKVRLSKEMSSDPAMHYTPRLWYYDNCTFLEDQYLPTKESKAASVSKSDFVKEEETESDERNEMEPEFLEDSSNSSNDHDEPPVKRRKDAVIRAESSDESPTKYSEEDLDCIGRGIALQMRNLDPYQSAIAHKLISETIFYAKIGKLTVDSHVVLNLGEGSDYSSSLQRNLLE